MVSKTGPGADADRIGFATASAPGRAREAAEEIAGYLPIGGGPADCQGGPGLP
jgi:hypothetical protein